MVQNVQDLINKIKHEGLEAGHEQAKKIEADAKAKADAIISQAHQEAEKIINEATARQQQLEGSTRASLQQAARDTILTLKQHINGILSNIIKQEIRQSLDKDQMSSLVMEVARQYFSQHKDARTVQVGLNEESRKILEKGIVTRLQQEVKAGVTIRSVDDLTGGFTISFDEGKSSFDFSEDALVEYLKKYVNEYVAELLNSKLAN